MFLERIVSCQTKRKWASGKQQRFLRLVKKQICPFTHKKFGFGEQQQLLILIKLKVAHSHKQYIECEISVTTVVTIKMTIFWDVKPCSLLVVRQHLRGPAASIIWVNDLPDDGSITFDTT
jgi:hypothetical protein